LYVTPLSAETERIPFPAASCLNASSHVSNGPPHGTAKVGSDHSVPATDRTTAIHRAAENDIGATPGATALAERSFRLCTINKNVAGPCPAT
jgi:hypothetical protein